MNRKLFGALCFIIGHDPVECYRTSSVDGLGIWKHDLACSRCGKPDVRCTIKWIRNFT